MASEISDGRVREPSRIAACLRVSEEDICPICGAMPGWFGIKGFGIRQRVHGLSCSGSNLENATATAQVCPQNAVNAQDNDAASLDAASLDFRGTPVQRTLESPRSVSNLLVAAPSDEVAPLEATVKSDVAKLAHASPPTSLAPMSSGAVATGVAQGVDSSNVEGILRLEPGAGSSSHAKSHAQTEMRISETSRPEEKKTCVERVPEGDLMVGASAFETVKSGELSPATAHTSEPSTATPPKDSTKSDVETPSTDDAAKSAEDLCPSQSGLGAGLEVEIAGDAVQPAATIESTLSTCCSQPNVESESGIESEANIDAKRLAKLVEPKLCSAEKGDAKLPIGSVEFLQATETVPEGEPLEGSKKDAQSSMEPVEHISLALDASHQPDVPLQQEKTPAEIASVSVVNGPLVCDPEPGLATEKAVNSPGQQTTLVMEATSAEELGSPGQALGFASAKSEASSAAEAVSYESVEERQDSEQQNGTRSEGKGKRSKGKDGKGKSDKSGHDAEVENGQVQQDGKGSGRRNRKPKNKR